MELAPWQLAAKFLLDATFYGVEVPAL